MFLSHSNRKIICDSIDETLPFHLKDRTLIDKNMQMFITQLDNKRTMIENNKAFLMFHVKSQIQVFDFDSEVKKKHLDFEEVTLKPQNEVSEVIDVVLDETTMENELRIKMEQRQQEMESILSQQKPIESEIHEKPEKLEIHEKYEEKLQLPKRVSFQEPEPDISSKMDIVLLELNIIKQEINELKKMFIILSRINPSESHNLVQL